ncbi:hypothetical protein San01_10320 [Streptomyces angustmyceticus]|uniref:Uncharacterized protein n=1 Tax=Streptomyces angustmyceticus TaxID=285578 RepID=A0A5J4LEI6_9ACTN|nr:hypothetical protein San01_10320 [Streptomyces angustmyceticus]
MGGRRAGPLGGRLGVAGEGRQRGTERECGRGGTGSDDVTHTHEMFPSGRLSRELRETEAVLAGFLWLVLDRHFVR